MLDFPYIYTQLWPAASRILLKIFFMNWETQVLTAKLIQIMLLDNNNYMICNRSKEKIPDQSLKHALCFSSRALEIITEESTIFTVKYFCLVSAVLLTPENTDEVWHSSSATGAFHCLGKLDDSKALYAGCKGRNLTEKFFAESGTKSQNCLLHSLSNFYFKTRKILLILSNKNNKNATWVTRQRIEGVLSPSSGDKHC